MIREGGKGWGGRGPGGGDNDEILNVKETKWTEEVDNNEDWEEERG